MRNRLLHGKSGYGVFWVLAVTVMVLVTSGNPAWAHKFRIFATAQGTQIKGYAYFSGGDRPNGATIELVDPSGAVIDTAITDERGRFALPLTKRETYVLRSKVDGHMAQWTIKASEEPPAVPDTGVEAAQNAAAGLSEGTQSAAAAASPKAAGIVLSQRDLDAVVEAAVARQVAPLREQIDSYENSTRLHDVLGGIGWLVGVLGCYAWWRGRKPKAA